MFLFIEIYRKKIAYICCIDILQNKKCNDILQRLQKLALLLQIF